MDTNANLSSLSSQEEKLFKDLDVDRALEELTFDDDEEVGDLDGLEEEVNAKLLIQINDVSKAHELILSHDFKKLNSFFAEHQQTSMYHALGHAAIGAIKSIAINRRQDLARAIESAHLAVKLSSVLRKKTSTLDYFKNAIPGDEYSDINCHAEIVYAEAQFFLAMLTAYAGRYSISGAIKAALRMKLSHMAFKKCEHLLDTKSNWNCFELEAHFNGGVYFALACEHLGLSYAPKFLMRLLEYIGLQGDRIYGLQMLEKAITYEDTVRWPLFSLLHTVYHAVIELFVGLGEIDDAKVRPALRYWSEKNPDAFIAKLCASELSLLNGNFDEAIKHLQIDADTNSKLSKFKIFEFASKFQIMNLQMAKFNWKEAAAAADYLYHNCDWSPCMIAYNYACALSMLSNEDGSDRTSQLKELLEKAATGKKHFGGKIAFHENIVSAKAKYYSGDVSRMCFAPLDLMYVFNNINIAAFNEVCLNNIIYRLEIELVKQELKACKKFSNIEKISFLKFMLGVCYSRKHAHIKAEGYLMDVIGSRKKLDKHERHLAAQATLEMGLISRALGDKKQAKAWFKRAMDYPPHVTSVMVKYRVNAALISLKGDSIGKIDDGPELL